MSTSRDDTQSRALSFLAPPPSETIGIGGGAEMFAWKAGSVQASTLIVPGWGMHPFYYGDLVRALLPNSSVYSIWSQPSEGRAGPAHYSELPAAVERVRDVTSRLRIVAESLGATHLLGQGVLRSTDRVALLAPGLLPRASQYASPRALRDLWSLALHDRLPIYGWRLRASSKNEAFLHTVSVSGFTPPYAGRAYLLAAASSAMRAAIARPTISRLIVMQGGADRLLTPLGSLVYYRHLRVTDEKVLETLPGAEHGLLWDSRYSDGVVARIVEFLGV